VERYPKRFLVRAHYACASINDQTATPGNREKYTRLITIFHDVPVKLRRRANPKMNGRIRKNLCRCFAVSDFCCNIALMTVSAEAAEQGCFADAVVIRN
jgi:hypothetical protein